MRKFLDHCLHGTNFATGKIGTPLDFISFHAKGAPVYTNDHVRMGIAAQLRTIEDGFKMIASYPELKNTPIVIGESDPEGCAACQGPQLGYRNGTMYSSYTAAVFARKWELARRYGVNLDAALTWAFTFEDQPLFAGFRQVASGGIDLPVLNVFRMFSKMNGQQVAVSSDSSVSLDDIKKAGVRERPDVSAIASLDRGKLAILLWHYHDDDLEGPAANINLAISRIPFSSGRATLARYLIDREHSNALTVWKSIGSPAQPTPAQYAELQQAGHLAQVETGRSVEVVDGKCDVTLNLARQGVELITLIPQ
jgi:xylan 1,4-beta-xylosidase